MAHIAYEEYTWSFPCAVSLEKWQLFNEHLKMRNPRLRRGYTVSLGHTARARWTKARMVSLLELAASKHFRLGLTFLNGSPWGNTTTNSKNYFFFSSSLGRSSHWTEILLGAADSTLQSPPPYSPWALNSL